MQREEHDQRRSEIAPATLALASVGSVMGTVVIGRFGLAGTLLGAALFPVVVALAKELTRRPARRLPRSLRSPGGRTGPEKLPDDRQPPGRRLADVPWRRVLVTAAAAFGVVVIAFSMVELAVGTSLVSDRPATFVPREEPAPAPEEPGVPPPAEPPPADEPQPPAEEPVEPPPPEEPAPPEEPPAEEPP